MMTRKAVIPERIHGLMALWALAVLRIERDPEPVFQEGDKLLAPDVETQSPHGDAVEKLTAFLLTQCSQPGLLTG